MRGDSADLHGSLLCLLDFFFVGWVLAGLYGQSISLSEAYSRTVSVRDNLPGGGRIIREFFQG